MFRQAFNTGDKLVTNKYTKKPLKMKKYELLRYTRKYLYRPGRRRVFSVFHVGKFRTLNWRVKYMRKINTEFWRRSPEMSEGCTRKIKPDNPVASTFHTSRRTQIYGDGLVAISWDFSKENWVSQGQSPIRPVWSNCEGKHDGDWTDMKTEKLYWDID